MSRTELSLAAAGIAGFGLATLCYYTGPDWLTGAGLLLAGVSVFWLYGIAHEKLMRQKQRDEDDPGAQHQP
jgi:hypothetical protein